jgi:undecaprenyl-diphosphatase
MPQAQITMLGAAIVNMTLKVTIHRRRPEPFFGLAAPDSFGFPGGHSLASLCFYCGLAGLISNRLGRRAKRTVWLGAASILFLAGISRVYLRVHYPSDVAGGYVAGLA